VVEPDRGATPEEGVSEHIQYVWTVANIITVLRLLLVPFFFMVLITGRSDLLAFALFAGAASTDWIDGQIARRTGTVTTLGKVMDPLVDRLLLASGVLGLHLIGRLSIWLVIVLVARDVYLLYGAYRLEKHGLRMGVTYAGKVTTAVLLTGFSLAILGWPVFAFELGDRELNLLLGTALIYAGTLLSLGTALQYTVRARRLVSRHLVTGG
jgi:cardiolipin synthase